jgi:hypothetical protein
MKKVFTSFDYDHDEDLRTLLVGQARHPDSPFQMSDWSVREPMTGDWKAKVERRINNTDLVAIICGHNTDTAAGVAVELAIAKYLRKPYFLLCGRANDQFRRPRGAEGENVYNWTWDNLKNLIGGAR